jgi:hypothetical protein
MSACISPLVVNFGISKSFADKLNIPSTQRLILTINMHIWAWFIFKHEHFWSHKITVDFHPPTLNYYSDLVLDLWSMGSIQLTQDEVQRWDFLNKTISFGKTGNFLHKRSTSESHWLYSGKLVHNVFSLTKTCRDLLQYAGELRITAQPNTFWDPATY